MNLNQVVEKISKEVSPSIEETRAEKQFAEGIIKKLEKEFGKTSQLIRIIHCGSSARDTGLKNDRDIDLFVAFDKKFERETIVSATIDAAKKAVKANWEMHYAEHPYLHADIGEYSVEVIPCFQHNPHEDIKSAVDRSPLHMTYLQEKLTVKQRSEVRVLKKLLKTAKIYGAENEIEGFSGLVCEYLMLNYQSLENLLKEASNWKFPVVIDTEKHHADIQSLKKKYDQNPIILIDMIDRNRNAAAAISKTSSAKFVMLARKILSKPSLEFFKEKAEQIVNKQEFLKLVKKRKTKLIALEFEKPNVVHDTLIPQIRSSAQFIARHLELNSMILNDYTFFTSETKCAILFEFEKWNSSIKKLQGPPADNPNACNAFITSKKKEKNSLRLYVKDLKLVAESIPDFSSAMQILEQVKKTPEKYGVAKNLKKYLSKAKILDETKISQNEFIRKNACKFLTLKEF